MKKVDRLRHEAEKAAKVHGHKLGRWEHGRHAWSEYAHAVCNVCKADVQVETTPAPNSINIGGSAVALNCSEVSA